MIVRSLKTQTINTKWCHKNDKQPNNKLFRCRTQSKTTKCLPGQDKSQTLANQRNATAHNTSALLKQHSSQTRTSDTRSAHNKTTRQQESEHNRVSKTRRAATSAQINDTILYILCASSTHTNKQTFPQQKHPTSPPGLAARGLGHGHGDYLQTLAVRPLGSVWRAIYTYIHIHLSLYIYIYIYLYKYICIHITASQKFGGASLS